MLESTLSYKSRISLVRNENGNENLLLNKHKMIYSAQNVTGMRFVAC